MADGIGPLGLCNLHNTLCNDGARERRSEHIFLVLRPRHHRGDDIVVYEFVRKILNVYFGCSRLDCLFLESLKLIALSDISADRYNITIIIIFLEPRNNN